MNEEKITVWKKEIAKLRKELFTNNEKYQFRKEFLLPIISLRKMQIKEDEEKLRKKDEKIRLKKEREINVQLDNRNT